MAITYPLINLWPLEENSMQARVIRHLQNKIFFFGIEEYQLLSYE